MKTKNSTFKHIDCIKRAICNSELNREREKKVELKSTIELIENIYWNITNDIDPLFYKATIKKLQKIISSLDISIQNEYKRNLKSNY
jgi:hypothetical protein